MKGRARVVWAAVVLAWVVPAIVSRSAFAQMPVTRVVVTEAQVKQIPATVELVGTLLPVRRSRVSSEVAGRVLEMAVRQGDAVRRGDVVCKLNDDLIQLRLAESRGRLGALEARHAELLAGTRKEQVARLAALLAEAQAQATRWKFEEARVENLYTGKAVSSVKEYYDTQAQYQAAEQRRIAAQAAYDEALAGSRKEVIAQAKYAVEEQQAVVDRLNRELDKTSIRAPFDGYIIDRVVEVGEWVTAGGTVVELADLSSVLVRVDVPESVIPYAKVGEAAPVKIDALKRTFEGRVAHVIRQANVEARTFPVEIRVDNPQGVLAAGMFSRVTMVAGPKTASVAVPKDAIVDRGGTSYVAMVVPGERGGLMGIPMAVTTGADIGDWLAITSHNVQPGMQIVTRGNERITFPSPVEVVDKNGTPRKLEFGKGGGGHGQEHGATPGGATGTDDEKQRSGREHTKPVSDSGVDGGR